MSAKRVGGVGQPMHKGGYRQPGDRANELPDPVHADFTKRTKGGRPSTKQKDFSNMGGNSPIAKNEM